jgi:Tol biopolymer transport system component
VLLQVGGPVTNRAEASFPGGNGEIVFIRVDEMPSPFRPDVWVVRPDGTNLHRLTDSSDWEYWPTWSPDGSQIAFPSSVDPAQHEVWVMEHDGSDPHQVTDLPADIGAQEAAWSPDGDRFVIEGQQIPSLYSDLYVVGVDGSGLAQITDYAGSETKPVWAPDGDRIAFSWNGDLWTVAPDGSNPTLIVDLPTPVMNPDWSPDSEQIAFAEYNGTTFTWRIWIVDSGGGNPTPITEDWGNYTNTEPAWSPDGTMLVYRNNDDEIAIMNADGTGRRSLGVDGQWPDWRPAFNPPVALDDGPFEVETGKAVTGRVLSNDHDPDGAALSAVKVSDPLHGALTFSSDGAFEFTAHLGYVGSDSFTYKAFDGYQYSDEATVTLHVIAVPPGAGLVDPVTGEWRLRDTAGVVTLFFYGNPGDYPFMGDWDCDGVDTPGLFRQSDAYAYLRNSNSQGIADIRFFFGNPSDIPLAGDFNGDGCDTLSIYRPSEARFYIINKLGENEGGLGAAEYSFLFGNPGDKPVVGDWDGDGIDEIGLHRELTGFFYYRNTLTTGIADGQFYFGDPGDRFVAGDWGVVDGVETPAMYRPSNTTFYFRHTLTQGNADSQFIWTGAGTGWLPVSGEFRLG